MLLINHSVQEGHCNGTRYIVIQATNDYTVLKAITGKSKGAEIALSKHKFCTDPEEWPFMFSRLQFPVVPCFAITAHKAQGQTLDRVGVALNENVFTHGQLYVILSRVRDPNNIKILRPVDKETREINSEVKNTVYREIL